MHQTEPRRVGVDAHLSPEEFRRLQNLDKQLYFQELDAADASLEALELARGEAVEAWLARLEELTAQLQALRRAYKDAESLYVAAAQADQEYQRGVAGHYCQQDPPEPLPPYPGRFRGFVASLQD
ncbi:MAG: hypothetical protein KIS61_09330 [Candidatus Eremiobacteraeota bacterium]|nr:hypothetical protein [Candidatus Eremiobacteraeota bacterium]